MPGRREFLKTLVGGVAASAAVRTRPFRVYSFPRRPHIIGRIDQLNMSLWGRNFTSVEVDSADFGMDFGPFPSGIKELMIARQKEINALTALQIDPLLFPPIRQINDAIRARQEL